MKSLVLFTIFLTLNSIAAANEELSINRILGLEDSGFTFEGAITTEWVKNTKGGLRTDDAWLGNVDLTLGVDTEKAGWWANGEIFMYILGNYNSSRVPTDFIGDIQATSNIDAPETWKIFELWYQHSFADGKFQLLAGLHDYNSDFYALEYSGIFRGSSFGIGPDISQIGNGPSIFPTTSLGIRLKFNFENAYVLAAVYDGFPGDRDDDNGTQVSLKKDDGLLYVVEAGFTGTEDNYYKIAWGVWYHTLDTEDNSGDRIDDNWGTYVVSEKSINNWLGAFLQIGYASQSRNAVNIYTSTGINIHNLSFMGEGDELGLAVARVWLGDDFRNNNPGFNQDETAVELTYSKRLTDNLRIQPGIQFISNPSSDTDIADALQISIMIELTF